MTTLQLLRWNGHRLRPVAELDPPEIIDSFVVSNGMARGASVHLARFAASVASRFRIAHGHLVPFVGAAARHLQHATAFVRFEVAADGQPGLRLRVIPPPPRSVRLWIGAQDQRTSPRQKGPDLAASARLRQQALEQDCDAGAFVVGPGDEPDLVEADYAAIVGVVDGALVCSRVARRLPSVTEHLLRCIARSRDMPIEHLRVSPATLRRGTFWLANARIGLVPVSGYRTASDDTVELQPDQALTKAWRTRLAACSRPVEPDAWVSAVSEPASVLQST